MDKIEELLTRGVDKIYPSKEALEKVLRSGKKLKLYQGFDPTGTKLHIGHIVGLRKLAQWQNLGHQIIFLIGDGTGQAGDPSGKTKAREKFMTREELRANAKDYVMQASKIVRFDGENPVEILYNGDWLNKLTLVDILKILDHLSLQQLVERDLFQERMRKGEQVIMREFIYPILQGYDSVAMDVDLELGGSDQTFNMLVGRKLVQEMLHKEKFVMTTPLLADSEGKKIGKTEGNAIAITDNPTDLYGKIMAFPDEVIIKAFEYLTAVPMEEIRKIEQQMDDPMTQKKRLAFEIVKELGSEKEATDAQSHFGKTVQDKELEPLTIHVSDIITTADEAVVRLGLAESKSEAKRLIEQGGIKINNKRINDPKEKIEITRRTRAQRGRKLVENA